MESTFYSKAGMLLQVVVMLRFAPDAITSCGMPGSTKYLFKARVEPRAEFTHSLIDGTCRKPS